MTYCVYWRAGEPNKPAEIGGFLRCDTQDETEFIAQVQQRGGTTHVSEETRNVIRR